MIKRIIAVFLFTFSLIFLIIPIHADYQKELEITAIGHKEFNTATVSNGAHNPWSIGWVDKFNFNGQTMGQPQQMFLFASVDGVFSENQYIVWTFEIQNTKYEQLSINKLKFLDSDTLFSLDTYDKLKETEYDAQIIAITNAIVDGEDRLTQDVRFTVTIKTTTGSVGKNGILWYLSPLTLYDTSQYNRTVSSIHIYESIEGAAGSGTTPEEMRAVLDDWSEEQLIPGIGDEIKDSYKELINEESEEAAGFIEEFTEVFSEQITPYFENTDQIRDAIHGGATGIFGYTGTDAVITLPAARNPFTGNSIMWNEYQIDLGMYYLRLPAVLRQLISALLTMLVSIGVLREMLDTVNTILIHREMLGMPDDHLKSWTRKDG